MESKTMLPKHSFSPSQEKDPIPNSLIPPTPLCTSTSSGSQGFRSVRHKYFTPLLIRPLISFHYEGLLISFILILYPPTQQRHTLCANGVSGWVWDQSVITGCWRWALEMKSKGFSGFPSLLPLAAHPSIPPLPSKTSMASG